MLPILDYLEKAGGIGAWEYASKITPALSNLEEDQVYEVNGATTAELPSWNTSFFPGEGVPCQVRGQAMNVNQRGQALCEDGRAVSTDTTP